MQLAENLYAFPWRSFTVNNCNSYLIDGDFKILIDPGHYHLFNSLLEALEGLKIAPADIDLVIATHIHPDHIEAVQAFSGTQTMFALPAAEYEYYGENGLKFFGLDFEPDFLLGEGTLNTGNTEIRIIHAPGHTPGSICIYWPSRKSLFVGDVLFEHGIGRTDLPGGNTEHLRKSVEHLSSIDVDILLPGHGNIIVGQEQVARNFSLVKQIYFGL